LKATWVAHIPAITSLTDAGAVPVRAPYGAIAFDCPAANVSLESTIRSAREARTALGMPVWPMVNDDFFSRFGANGQHQLVEFLTSQGAPPASTLILHSRLVERELAKKVSAWRQAVAAMAAVATLRVIVTREPHLSSPAEAERIEWFELDAAQTATAFGGVDSPYSGALKWVVERLELLRQSPAESHLSVYIDPAAETDSRRACFRYWITEAEIIATNNPGVMDRLLLVRGATHLLASQRALPPALHAPPEPMRRDLRTARIAVVLHMHYPELWPDFATGLASISEPFDLYVSTGIGIDRSVAAVVHATHPNAMVIAVENRGRDVWPFFAVHARFDLASYSLICKAHSKRSQHFAAGTVLPVAVTDGNDWRQQLLTGLMGSPQTVSEILAKFDDPSVGMVCPAAFIKTIATGTSRSKRRVEHLMRELELQVPESAQFAAGTMFWARTAAIEPLLLADFQSNNFEAERGQVDFTLHHAIERIFGLVVSALGFHIAPHG